MAITSANVLAGCALVLLLATCAVGTVALFKEFKLPDDWLSHAGPGPMRLGRRGLIMLTIGGIVAGLIVALGALWALLSLRGS